MVFDFLSELNKVLSLGQRLYYSGYIRKTPSFGLVLSEWEIIVNANEVIMGLMWK